MDLISNINLLHYVFDTPLTYFVSRGNVKYVCKKLTISLLLIFQLSFSCNQSKVITIDESHSSAPGPLKTLVSNHNDIGGILDDTKGIVIQILLENLH